MTTFPGLPADYFRFFKDIRENNNREWFNDNKQRFRESVQEPLASLVEAMAPRLKKISKHFVADPRLNGGSVFRIYKDVRFSKDKTPYKTHGAVQFRHALGKNAHAPGFYIHLDPAEIFYGGGIWTPPSPQLKMIRESIQRHPAVWEKATTSADFKNRFGELRGDGLVRPPRGFDAEHPLIADIKRMSFFAMAQGKPVQVKKSTFCADIEEAMKDAKPLMKFLCDAVGAPI